MLPVHIKTAIVTLRRSKGRSVLTMLGVIVGVASVVTAISLGEGVKQQVRAQIDKLGPDVVTVLPGRIDSASGSRNFAGQNAKTFSEADVRTIKDVPGVKLSVPLAVVSGVAESNGHVFDGSIVGTTGSLPEVFGQDISYGSFFNEQNFADKYVAVIGKTAARQLFDENVPIGKAFTIRGQEFRVRAVFDDFETSPLTPGINYNTAIFIPYDTAKQINGGSLSAYEVLVKPVNDKQVDQVIQDITIALKDAHGGAEDFSLLKQEQNLATSNTVLNLLTSLAAGIAAISLLVGGIGIMNIMLLSVSERYHEIGVRKAVGATNQQILGQFITEASLVSLAGGVIGVVLALLANYSMRVFTDLKPVVTWQVSLVAIIVAMVVGITFGIIPAWQAAKKDPIEALRHE